MKIYKYSLIISAFVLLSGQAFSQMSILSGPEKGSYYRFAKDIVTVLGEKNGIKLINRTTGGSAYNFKRLTDPATADKIAFIQSDYLNMMEAEDKLNNTNKTGSMKIVLQLAREEIQIVARKSSGFQKLQDLEKKKVAIGSDDQGSVATGKLIRERSKVDWTSCYVEFNQLVKDLSDNRIDAALVVGTAPLNMLDIDPQIMKDGIVMVELDDFNDWARYYENDTVYHKEYKWLEKDVPTFGVRTLLVVNESKLTDADKKTVASIRSGIIQNLDQLKKQGHPKWKDVIIPDDPETTEAKSATITKTAVTGANDKKDVVTYRVQVYSRNYQKTGDQITVNGSSYKTNVYFYLGAYRYTIGEFTDLSSASELQNLCRKAGYNQSFVAAFVNNVRSTDPGLFK